MSQNDFLFLYEEVMLLSLRDEKGTPEFGAMYTQAIGGAVLAELLLAGRIEVEREKKKRFARVVSEQSLDDPLLDECLQRIRDSKKRQQLSTWVTRFGQTKRLKHRVAEQLCQRKILRADDGKVLLIFKRKIYPEFDPKPEREIIARLKKAIFGAGSVDSRTVVLVALAHHANLLKNAFEKKKLKERKKRIENLTSDDAAGNAAKDAIRAARAAAAAAAISAGAAVISAVASMRSG